MIIYQKHVQISFVADIMFLLRRLVHDGSPVSTISDSLLYDISLRVDGVAALTRPQKDWLSRLLTTGI